MASFLRKYGIRKKSGAEKAEEEEKSKANPRAAEEKSKEFPKAAEERSKEFPKAAEERSEEFPNAAESGKMKKTPTGKALEVEKTKKSRGLLWMAALLAVAVLCTYLPTGEIIARVTSSGVINNEERDLPIYSVETEEKVVALSFDAAWGNEDTQNILDILAEYDVKVTFFMTGGWVETYPEDVKHIYEAGHDLGNHSENHKNMSQLSVSEISDELQKVHEKVQELTGVEMDLFRPPYGDYDNDVVGTARNCGYYTIQWDVDSLDWKDYGADSIVNTVLHHKNLRNGSIILMHNGAKYTAQALPRVIEGLKEQGYTIIPISELILRENYTIDHTGRQNSCSD